MNVTVNTTANISNLPSVSESGKTKMEEQSIGAKVISGNGVTVVTDLVAAAKMFGNMPADQVLARLDGMEPKMLLEMMEEYYEALKAVVDNLKPSDEQQEQVEKREEELRKLLDELEQLIKETKEQELDRDIQVARFAQILSHNDVWEGVWGPVFGQVVA